MTRLLITLLVLGLSISAYALFLGNSKENSSSVAVAPTGVNGEKRPSPETEKLAISNEPSERTPAEGVSAMIDVVNPEESDEISKLRRAVFSGKLSRDASPGEYDAAIRKISVASATGSLRNDLEGRAGMLAGFDSWDHAMKTLAVVEARDPVAGQDLREIVDLALALSGEIERAAIESLEAERSVEVWDPERPHDPKGWKEVYGNPERGACRFSLSNNVGDRVFKLHFNSADHPLLNSRLLELRSRLAYHESAFSEVR